MGRGTYNPLLHNQQEHMWPRNPGCESAPGTQIIIIAERLIECEENPEVRPDPRLRVITRRPIDIGVPRLVFYNFENDYHGGLSPEPSDIANMTSIQSIFPIRVQHKQIYAIRELRRESLPRSCVATTLIP